MRMIQDTEAHVYKTLIMAKVESSDNGNASLQALQGECYCEIEDFDQDRFDQALQSLQDDGYLWQYTGGITGKPRFELTNAFFK